MLRATVLLVAALTLVGCTGLGDWQLPAPAPTPDNAAAETAIPTAAPVASPPPSTTAAAEPAPPPPVMAQAAPLPAATAPAPSPPPPRGGAACAMVTENGPAREIDLDRVRTLLRGGDYRRGTFETNAGYRTRIGAKLEAIEALAVERTGHNDLVFSLPIPAYRLTYDADAHELWIGSELGLLRGGSAIGMGDFILVSSLGAPDRPSCQHHRLRLARHAGAHPGGVEDHRRPARHRAARRLVDRLAVELRAAACAETPNEAAAAKQALAVLFVGHLLEPYFITGEFIQEPKRDDPVEKRLTVEALKLQVDCAAIYDRRSGRLIRPAPARRPLTRPALGPAPPLVLCGARQAPVAQLDRALPSEGRGHKFESCRGAPSFPRIFAGHSLFGRRTGMSPRAIAILKSLPRGADGRVLPPTTDASKQSRPNATPAPRHVIDASTGPA